MKRVFAAFIFLAACETTMVPMPEVPSFGKADGGAGVQAINQKLTLDARIYVHARINYDVNWDGLLGGATNSAYDQRAVWPASQLGCPKLWIWVSHDPSGSATWALEQSYSMYATQTSIGLSDYPTMSTLRWQYFKYCDYVFKEGGGETWRNGIPVQSGDNWVGYGVQCPSTTTGPTALTNIVKINVPAGSFLQYNLPDISGPANAKDLWAPIAQWGCGWGADSWWASPNTLHIGWCQVTPPSTTCNPGSMVDLQRTW